MSPFSRRRDDELGEELRAHLDAAIRERIARGESPADAAANARREFGNIGQVTEATRQSWGGIWIEQLVQDVRYAARSLRNAPGFTAVIIVTLALGIGGNAAIFSVIDALVLRTLPVREPERLVVMTRRDDPRNTNHTLNYERVERLARLTGAFDGVAAVNQLEQSNVVVDGSADDAVVNVGTVTWNYFSVLGVGAVRGRTLSPDDDRGIDGRPVVVISHRYWERRFALAPDIVGRTLSLAGTTYSVVGVTPAGFDGEVVGKPTDFWVPLALAGRVVPSIPVTTRGAPWGYHPIARLSPGVTMEHAQALATAEYKRHLTDDAGAAPSADQLRWIQISRVVLDRVGAGFKDREDSLAQPLSIAMGMAGLVLVIVCANVANLALARAAVRRREIAVRLALGAARERVLRQLLTENLLLAAVGGACGALLAAAGAPAVAAFTGAGLAGRASETGAYVPLQFDVRPDVRVLLAGAAVSLVAAIAFGLLPALRGTAVPLAPSLRERGSLADISLRRWSVAKVLVVSQVALSVLLLVGAGLFVRTLHRLRTGVLGVDRDHVLLVTTSLRQSNRRIGAPVIPLIDEVQRRLGALPGVTSVGAATRGFLNGNSFGGPAITVPGMSVAPGDETHAQTDLVTPQYFESMGMPVLLGRDFNQGDTERSAPVVIINASLARRLFGDENPIGRHLAVQSSIATGGDREIVGVVGDSKHVTPRDVGRMMFYVPYRQDIPHLMSLVLAVRTAGAPLSAASRVREELRAIDANLPVRRLETVGHKLDDALATERLIAEVASVLGAVATLLACLGLYGLVSYVVAKRVNEFGIRAALGAARRDALILVLREGVGLAFVGVAIGVPVALVATRLVRGRLFEISVADPATVAAASVMMLLVAALAALIPARRAASVDPMVALRAD